LSEFNEGFSSYRQPQVVFLEGVLAAVRDFPPLHRTLRATILSTIGTCLHISAGSPWAIFAITTIPEPFFVGRTSIASLMLLLPLLARTAGMMTAGTMTGLEASALVTAGGMHCGNALVEW
jgi:hypothetical protein